MALVPKIIFLCVASAFTVKLLADGACSQVFFSGVDANNRTVIVNYHNFMRREVASGNSAQPKASNMKRLSWDTSLAQKAQKLADSCVFAHQRFTDPRFGAVGQNLYINLANSPQAVNWKLAIDYWNAENKSYTYPNGFSENTGHYTQLIWANTNLVGCGAKGYYDNKYKAWAILYACNYGPAGNVQGEKPYETGQGCNNLC